MGPGQSSLGEVAAVEVAVIGPDGDTEAPVLGHNRPQGPSGGRGHSGAIIIIKWGKI